MITVRGNRYIVINTITKEVLSEHEFEEGNKQSIAKAKEDALTANEAWKSKQ